MLLNASHPRSKNPLKIAVIGGGISGMGAAYSLCSAHKVTLFEARSRLGGHARTELAGPDKNIPVDTGFMVFNYRNYPHLNALFETLAIPVKPSDMSFAVSLNDGRFEYGLHKPKQLFGDPRNTINPKFWKMIADILKFNKQGSQFKDDESATIGDVIDQLGLSNVFRDRYLGPLAGAIWSTSSSDMLNFPAQSLIRFFENHGLMSRTDNPAWFTVDGGSKVYVDRMSAVLSENGCNIRTNCPVKSVKRYDYGVTVSTIENGSEEFDEVILACHSDQALKLLESPLQKETETLRSIRYKKNSVILHGDTSQMPNRKACWSSWVYKGNESDPDKNSFTYWMNLLQSIPNETPLFVTLNPTREIPSELIYNQTELAHPQFDLPALKAQKILPKMQGQNRTWYCGAYTKYGFHEDGFASGLDVAHQLHQNRAFQL